MHFVWLMYFCLATSFIIAVIVFLYRDYMVTEESIRLKLTERLIYNKLARLFRRRQTLREKHYRLTRWVDAYRKKTFKPSFIHRFRTWRFEWRMYRTFELQRKFLVSSRQFNDLMRQTDCKFSCGHWTPIGEAFLPAKVTDTLLKREKTF